MLLSRICKYLGKLDVSSSPPTGRQILVGLKCVKDLPYQHRVKRLSVEQVIAMPNVDLELFGKLVHAQSIEVMGWRTIAPAKPTSLQGIGHDGCG